MSKPDRNIAIIGGGLAGLVLALYLHKHQLKCTVYERELKSYSQGGFIVLGPNGVRVLSDIGVWTRIQPQGYSFSSLTLGTNSGSILGTVYMGGERLYQYPAVRIARTAIKAILVAEVESKGIEVVYEKVLSSLSETDEVVNLSFADGSVVSADLVVGADGIRSVVRKHIDPVPEPYYNGLTLIYGNIKKDQLNEAQLNSPIPCMNIGPCGSFVVMPTNKDGSNIGFFGTATIPDRSREEWKAFNEDKEAKKRLLGERYAVKEWPALTQALCEKVDLDGITSWPIFVLPIIPKWSTDSKRILILGDAAHAMSPGASQGAAMAWEDAQTLAIALSTSIPLDKWEAHRKERVRKAIEYADYVEKMRRPSPNRVLQKLKETSTWALLKWHGEEGLSSWIFSYEGADEMKALL